MAQKITPCWKSFYKPEQGQVGTVTDFEGLIWGSGNRTEMKQDRDKKKRPD